MRNDGTRFLRKRREGGGLMADPVGRRQTSAAWVALFTAMLIWALSFIVTKDALERVSPASLLAIRFFIGALVLVVPVARRHGLRLQKRNLLPLALAALLNPVAYYLLQTTGLRLTTASHASGISAIFPVLVFAFSVLARRESITGRRVFGVLCGALGIGMIAATGLFEPGASVRGDLIVLLAMACSAVQIICLKSLLEQLPAIKVLFYQCALAAVVFASAAAVSGPLWIAGLGPKLIGELLFLGLFSSIVAFVLHYAALRRLPATNVATATGLVPVLTILFDRILFGLTPTPLKLVGVALVLGGIVMTQSGTPVPARSERARLPDAGG